jgi:hypothetical protein
MTTLASQLAGNWTDASYLDDANTDWALLRLQLEQGNAQVRREALKRVLALSVQGQPVAKLLPAVVSNLLQADYELKRLVCIFLQQHADDEPHLVLLAVNALFKDLQHNDPWVRSQALRLLTSLRVPALRQVMWLAIHRGVRDRHPQVRLTAALSIPPVLTWNEPDGAEPAQSLHQLPVEQIASALTAPLWQLLLNDREAPILVATAAALGMLDRDAMLNIPVSLVERLGEEYQTIPGNLLPIALHQLLRYVLLRTTTRPERMTETLCGEELTRFVQAVDRLARKAVESLSAAVAVSGALTLYHLRRSSDNDVTETVVRTLLRYALDHESGLKVLALRMLHVLAWREPACLTRYAPLFVPTIGTDEPAVYRHQLGILVKLVEFEETLCITIMDRLVPLLKCPGEELAIMAARALALMAAVHPVSSAAAIPQLIDIWRSRSVVSPSVYGAVGLLLLRMTVGALRTTPRERISQAENLLKEIVLNAAWIESDSPAQSRFLWIVGTMIDHIGTVADEVLRRWMQQQQQQQQQHRLLLAAPVRLELLRLARTLAARRTSTDRAWRALNSLLVAGLEDDDVDVLSYAVECAQSLDKISVRPESVMDTMEARVAQSTILIDTDPTPRAGTAEAAAAHPQCAPLRTSSIVDDVRTDAIDALRNRDAVAFAVPSAWTNGCLLCAWSACTSAGATFSSCLPENANLLHVSLPLVPSTEASKHQAAEKHQDTSTELQAPVATNPVPATDSLALFFGETTASATTTAPVAAAPADKREDASEPLIAISSPEQTSPDAPVDSTLHMSVFDALLTAGLVSSERVEQLRPRMLAENSLDALFQELIAAASGALQPSSEAESLDALAAESAGLLPTGAAQSMYEAPVSLTQVPEATQQSRDKRRNAASEHPHL